MLIPSSTKLHDFSQTNGEKTNTEIKQKSK